MSTKPESPRFDPKLALSEHIRIDNKIQDLNISCIDYLTTKQIELSQRIVDLEKQLVLCVMLAYLAKCLKSSDRKGET